MAFTGKLWGLGSPPPKEIISGFSVTFKISLTKDRGVLDILCAKLYFIGSSLHQFSKYVPSKSL
jgi:hypothetical protein